MAKLIALARFLSCQGAELADVMEDPLEARVPLPAIDGPQRRQWPAVSSADSTPAGSSPSPFGTSCPGSDCDSSDWGGAHDRTAPGPFPCSRMGPRLRAFPAGGATAETFFVPSPLARPQLPGSAPCSPGAETGSTPGWQLPSVPAQHVLLQQLKQLEQSESNPATSSSPDRPTTPQRQQPRQRSPQQAPGRLSSALACTLPSDRILSYPLQYVWLLSLASIRMAYITCFIRSSIAVYLGTVVSPALAESRIAQCQMTNLGQ